MQSLVILVGNLVDDVTLRATSSGTVASFRMAASNGFFDRRTQRWVERSTYLTVSAWRQLGENLAASLHKGQPVLVVGRMRQRDVERDGRRVTYYEVDAECVGHDLSRGSAVFARNARGPQTTERPVLPAALDGSAPVPPVETWGVPGLEPDPLPAPATVVAPVAGLAPDAGPDADRAA